MTSMAKSIGECDAGTDRESWLPGQKIATVNMPVTFLSLIDEIVEIGAFPSRSHAFRVVILRFFREIGYDTTVMEREMIKMIDTHDAKITRKIKRPKDSTFDTDVVEYYVSRCRKIEPPDEIDRRGSRIITVAMTRMMLASFDLIKKNGAGFFSRSEFIRNAITSFLKDIGWLQCIYKAKQSKESKTIEKRGSTGKLDFRKRWDDDELREIIINHLKKNP